MGGSKPKAIQTPFENKEAKTYGNYSIADTPEAKNFLNTPLDFGSEINVDPGVGRRTALAGQDVANRYDNAFMSGVPAWIRQANRAKELREVEGQGAYEDQQAQYLNQQGNNALRSQRTAAELERRRLLLPQILQTGGSSTGFNTQIQPGTPGFFSTLGMGLGSALGGIGGSFLGKIPGLK